MKKFEFSFRKTKKYTICILGAALSMFMLLSCASCTSKKEAAVSEPEPEVTEQQTEEVSEPEPVPEPAPVKEPEPEKKVEPEPVPEPTPEPEPAPQPEPKVEEVKEEPKKEEPKKEEPKDEYARSVGDVDVSRDTFAEDKERILKIISALDVIMKDFDYKSWLTYVDQDSINYWSRPANLKKAQSRLPVKGLRLTSLQDYFKYVFVPARKGRKITEIRYISETYIKAIEVGEEQDIVYYYFNKINGHWMINLPPIDD